MRSVPGRIRNERPLVHGALVPFASLLVKVDPW
jgi:hypothetical protein